MQRAASLRLWSALLVAALFGVATAQSLPATVGELIARGGSQLTGPELRSLITDAKLVGIGPLNRDITFELVAQGDGRFRGVVGASRIDADGTWTISEKGQFCWQVTARRGQTTATCTFWFRLGAEYFASTSNEADAVPLLRRVSK